MADLTKKPRTPPEEELRTKGEMVYWCDTTVIYKLDGWYYQMDQTGKFDFPAWAAPGTTVSDGPVGAEVTIVLPFEVGDHVQLQAPFMGTKGELANWARRDLAPHINKLGVIIESPHQHTVRLDDGTVLQHVWDGHLKFIGRPIIKETNS